MSDGCWNVRNYYLCSPLKNGRLAERLGRALQKLLRRFESATDLSEGDVYTSPFLFLSLEILFAYINRLLHLSNNLSVFIGYHRFEHIIVSTYCIHFLSDLFNLRL